MCVTQIFLSYFKSFVGELYNREVRIFFQITHIRKMLRQHFGISDLQVFAIRLQPVLRYEIGRTEKC